MDIVTRIFDALGGPTEIAAALSLPIQTVHSWKVAPQNIPAWRRQPLIEAARRKGVQLNPDLLEYLASTDRAAQGRAA